VTGLTKVPSTALIGRVTEEGHMSLVEQFLRNVPQIFCLNFNPVFCGNKTPKAAEVQKLHHKLVNAKLLIL
jgi:hypothetical protein